MQAMRIDNSTSGGSIITHRLAERGHSVLDGRRGTARSAEPACVGVEKRREAARRRAIVGPPARRWLAVEAGPQAVLAASPLDRAHDDRHHNGERLRRILGGLLDRGLHASHQHLGRAGFDVPQRTHGQGEIA